MGSPLNRLDKKRLRRWLLLFFLALLIPTILLVQQSYSRLKWETFHQHQLMAAELSERIDRRLIQLIQTEDQRAFTDYSFIKTTTDTKASAPQRSPLAGYPIQAQPPGLIGYFQVDAAGTLVTPTMPDNTQQAPDIKQHEFRERIALQNKIQKILVANRLVRNLTGWPAAPATTVAMSHNSAGDSLPTVANNAQAENAELLVEAESADELPPANSRIFGQSASRVDTTDYAADNTAKQAPIDFGQLKEISKQSAQKSTSNRVEDLQIQQNYSQKDADKRLKTGSTRKQKLASADKSKTSTRALEARDTSRRIRTFDNEIDPFEFSQLDSKHFVLFRQVWRNGQRYTQGLLIEQSAFLEQLINSAFTQTTLSDMSDLLVAYQGSVLTAFSGQLEKNQRYQREKITEQQLGEQLYQVRLSDPLSDLQLIYSITQLPIGPGGQLILWLALLLGVILLGGFYLMYRLGLRQIELANQQQDFVSAVSHELKTPLTSIRMYGEMLIQGWAPEERKNTYYQFIFDESERLSRLINNVLQLARMTRNEQKAELALHNVADLVQDIKGKITSQIEAADFSFTINTDDRLATEQIMVDADWLTQIMINLVDNAIKFSAKAEQRRIILDVSRTGQQVNFTISDFGPGIDKQQMQKIFQLFYRSEDELTRDTVGTGIGLSLVHQMTTAMGGKVSVENRGVSAAFSGAAFRVSFPISN